MQLTKITVRFGMTYNLGDYTNTRPEIELQAEIETGDNPTETIHDLRRRATRLVHDAIDAELEALDQPPRYWDGPRFVIIQVVDEKIAAIVPVESLSSMPPAWRDGSYKVKRRWKGHRYEIVKYKAEALDGYTLFDCADGDIDRLPSLGEWCVVRTNEPLPDGHLYLALLPEGLETSLPGRWANSWHSNRSYHVRRWATFAPELAAAAENEDRRFIDLSQGNLDQLPDWPVTDPEPEPVDPAYWDGDDWEDDDE